MAYLPMPMHLDPPKSARSLASSVRAYFYTLYNSANDAFRNLLASVNNKEAATGKLMFDRYEAVAMVKAAAKKNEDPIVSNAKEGDIYRCIVNILRQNGVGLKLRRQEYKRLTYQVPAE